MLSRLLGTAPEPTTSILDNPNSPASIAIDDILDGIQTDISRQNLFPLGKDFTRDEIIQYRRRARFRDPRALYELMDEMVRLGPGSQMRTATEAMKSARPQFVTQPEDWNDDDNVVEDADPAEVAAARAARDFLEDTLSPKLDQLIGIHANEHWYGIADSKLTLNPRGNASRWDSIEEIEEIPARRHRPALTTDEWLLCPNPDSYEGVPISELLLRSDSGNQGLFFTEIGAGSVHLDQRGVLIQCLEPWVLHQHRLRWSGRFDELYGVPPRWAEVDFSKPRRVTEALKALKDMGSTSFGVFHTGTKLNFAPVHSGTNHPFNEGLDWCERQYDKHFLGHSQATGVQKGVGGKMQGDQSTKIFEDITNSRLRTFAPQLMRLGRTLVARNLGTAIAERHAPIIRLRFEDRDDPTVLSGVALRLKQAGAGELVGVDDLVRRCLGHVASPGDLNLGAAIPAAGAAPVAADGSMQQQALRALASAEDSELPAIRRVIEEYQLTEKRRALEYGKRRVHAARRAR
jgi:Protein of unknown function (DUF935)